VELGGAKFILFFSSLRKKEERNSTHITHIGKAPRANALQKSATDRRELTKTIEKYLGE
jgi:hypothetical protein